MGGCGSVWGRCVSDPAAASCMPRNAALRLDRNAQLSLYSLRTLGLVRCSGFWGLIFLLPVAAFAGERAAAASDSYDVVLHSQSLVGLPLDGGGSGGNPGLSADAVTHLLYVFLYLASRGWRLDLLC
jgi:hypothetical protein